MQLKTDILNNDIECIYINSLNDTKNPKKTFRLGKYFLDKIEGIENENTKYIETIYSFKKIIDKTKSSYTL